MVTRELHYGLKYIGFVIRLDGDLNQTLSLREEQGNTFVSICVSFDMLKLDSAL